MITKITGQCAFKDCNEPATCIAAGSSDGHADPACYCDTHGDQVANEDALGSHGVTHCPNCHCRFADVPA